MVALLAVTLGVAACGGSKTTNQRPVSPTALSPQDYKIATLALENEAGVELQRAGDMYAYNPEGARQVLVQALEDFIQEFSALVPPAQLVGNHQARLDGFVSSQAAFTSGKQSWDEFDTANLAVVQQEADLADKVDD